MKFPTTYDQVGGTGNSISSHRESGRYPGAGKVYCPSDHGVFSIPPDTRNGTGSDAIEAKCTDVAYPSEYYNGGKEYKKGPKSYDGTDDGYDDDDDADLVVPQTKMGKKRDYFYVRISLLSLTFLSLVAYGFASKLFLPNKISVPPSSSSSVDGEGDLLPEELMKRQVYYDNLLTFLDLALLEPSTPQAQALEWLAFTDKPLEDDFAMAPSDINHGTRLRQRYALVTWYFAQGGPLLWSTINNDPSAGWINHGGGVHECKWMGIDCERVLNNDNDPGDDEVVIAIRLSRAVGAVLTGTSLSTEIGMLTHLRRLDVSEQRLQGSIPDEWRSLTNLEIVSLSNNLLQSTIPNWISEWNQLTTLVLDNNDFSGTLPSSLYNLSALRHIELQGNIEVQGRIDDLMSRMSYLEYIDISGMEGTIPSEVQMSNLLVFRVWNSKLSGSIPTEIGTWTSLETLSMAYVQFLAGSLPTEMGLMTNTTVLEITDAPNMVGSLPTELGLMTNLLSMKLSVTNRVGTLPVEYSNLTKLQTLDLYSNEGLTGTIPTEYGKLLNLSYVDLLKTSLVGQVSTEICAINIENFEATCTYEGSVSNDTLVCPCCTLCEAL